MDARLHCQITPGQFTGEYAVQGTAFNGDGFSLFATQNDIECRDFPEGDNYANALLRVRIVESRGELVLIDLPQQTLENGKLLTVRADQLSVGPVRTRQSA